MEFHKHIARRVLQPSGILLIVTVIFVAFLNPEKSNSQQLIAHVQPDALGPGMTIAMEILAPANDSGAFGADGIYLPSSKILLFNLADSFRVIFGPVVVSWNGRVLQVPVMAKTSAVVGTIHFQIITGNKKSALDSFEIVEPHPKLSISGDVVLGDASFVPYSFKGLGNTIVVDEIDFFGTDFQNKGLYIFSTEDTDTLAGNSHYHPVTLLSRGAIRLKFAEISVSADSLTGGPGGGGGGAGFAGIGGAGYTGGGSDSAYSPGNIGSGSNSTEFFGGSSSTGILGGESSVFPNVDQGGGGGTGCPYGSSGGISGGNDTSHMGGFGGGSAGGETIGTEFGGGGGAFATDGGTGAGFGNNGGKAYGGRFLLPMQGGSGGGAGNHVSELDSTAGSGGGGGGALTIISYDTISLTNSFLTADGTSGVSGVNVVDAGGGGGSGGAILLSARNGILMDNTTISANSGSGGLGGKGVEQTSKGGTGGKGRIRIDGEIDTVSNFFISGPTLFLSPIDLNGPYALLSGMAGDSASLTDSIRIYYRNQHSSWKFFDTVRFKSNGRFRWHAFLPTGHDSSLFVSVMAQVKAPDHSFANFEPERLLSHLSSGIIRTKATPHLVLEQDTLIFGCFKIGDTCVTANFYVANLGEDSLHIDSIIISKNNFSTGQKTKDIGYYMPDSLTIQYCPTTVGKDTSIITFISNDTTRTAVLIGCGINKDTRITLKPAILDFGIVHVGKCDTLKLTAHSVGTDSALLSPNGFFHPPFTILQPLKDTLLAPKDSVHILISFCPNDTGIFHSSFILTEKRDSVRVSGTGTIRIKALRTDDNLQGKSLCLNNCDTIKLKLSSIGNDPVTIDSIIGVTFASQTLPFVIPAQSDTMVTIRYCATEKGDTSVRITYISDADSSNTSLLHYHGVHPEFTYDSALNFGSLCPSVSEMLTSSIVNTGNDTINISSVRLLHGTPFTVSGDTISKTDTANVIVHFTPTASGKYNDTLVAVVRLGLCGDSILRIPISGNALNGDLIFSKTSISFGAVDTNSCKDDSVIVTNPCNNNLTLSIPPIPAPFFIKSPSGNTLTFGALESKTIIYSYCPKAVSIDSAQQTFILSSGGALIVALNGIGQPIIDSPFVRFKLDNIIATAGTQFGYLISVDTISSGTNIRSIKGSLHYDPTLVEPLVMTSAKWNISNSSGEANPGTYRFSASNTDSLVKGPFATLQMLALYGPRDSTAVSLDSINITNYSRSSVDSGSVKVVHCGNLPGHIIVAGAYALGNPTPNPTNGSLLSFPVTLGNDGILHLSIYNTSGMTALDRSYSLKRGENTIVLDVSMLPSGIYYLSADSWGWRDRKTLVIEK